MRRRRDEVRDLAIAFACFGVWSATAPVFLLGLVLARIFRQSDR